MPNYAVTTHEGVTTIYYITADTAEDARDWNGVIYDTKDVGRSDGEITEVREV